MSLPIIKAEIKGKECSFYATPMGQDLVNETFSDNYQVFKSGIEFAPGDVVLDIGACEGTFSIMMAKLYPQVRVVALEPVTRTFFQMMRNIGLNGVMNLEAYNVGAGKERGKRVIFMGKNGHSGGSSGVMTFNPDWHEKVEVELLGLADIFHDYRIEKVKLLKMDIEGMEYEVLYTSGDILLRVEHFVGEFHINARLDYQGYRMQGLASWVSNRTKVIAIEACPMAE